MNSTIEITIPAAIAALPLPIAEKIVLAHIANFSGCSNARLAKLISVTSRGVENMLRRLREKGYIEQSGKGRARRHRLLFHVEHHTKCGDTETTSATVKPHKECGDEQSAESRAEPNDKVSVVKEETPLAEDYEWTLKRIDQMFYEGGVFPEEFLYQYRRILKRVEDEAPQSEAKDAAVRELTIRRDAFVAICHALKMPRQDQRQALRLINNATPEMLAKFRRQVEAGQLNTKTPPLLTALADETEVMAEDATEDVSCYDAV